MSRVAKKPIALPKGVELNIQADSVSVKGPKGTLSAAKPAGVEIKLEDGVATLSPADPSQIAITGTLRAILANMVQGVSQGFERKLELVGVGYRAAMQGKDLSLSLGFSHPVVFQAPEGVSLATPTQTEVLVSGADKQAVGQAAAKIRAFRPPEPYKGKGVKYSDETIIRKEAKKA
ncbi:50S ribosomal protein L6 [Luteimonas abyssi]|uniref:50S ribosomal protein L6 n=1 Tax=Luteimonas abyssi TaxID=1247514 RepID=UPI000737C239|nr:50S ribosomal protein L6 [Luteimonas abyssi]